MIINLLILIFILLIINYYIIYKNKKIENFNEESAFEKNLENIFLSESEIPQEINLPKPSPVKLTGKLNKNSLELYWLPPEKGLETLKYYIVVMIKESEGPKILFPPDINCKLCQYTINSLEYGKKYKFGVLVTNENGTSDMSNMISIEPSVPKNYLKPKIPKKKFFNVTCMDDLTYTTDKFCHKNFNVEPLESTDDYNKIMDLLKKKQKELNFNIKII